jgi:hypothetical protein
LTFEAELLKSQNKVRNKVPWAFALKAELPDFIFLET